MHWIYVIGIVIGILVVWFVMHQQRRVQEPFAAGDAAGGGDAGDAGGAGGGATGSAAAGTYKEDLSRLPKASAVQFYLTSFSDLPNYAGVTKVYSGAETKWYNFVRDATAFTMVGTAIPATIRQMTEGEETYATVGLPLKSIKLVGPSSTLACGLPEEAATSTILGSFSVMFYGRLNSLTFDATNRKKVLFQMFAENPNHIEWSLVEKDRDDCYIELVLGNVNTTYRWIVPKSTLLSNGNPTLYGLTYNVGDVKRTFTIYVGTNKYVASSTDMTPIRLGYTPMEINSASNVDMILQSFVYMNNVLADADVPVWTEYFVNESGGLSRTLKFLKDTYANEITTLNTQLMNQTNSVDDLQRALEMCQAKLPEDTLVNKKEQWKIHLDGDGATISTEDAKKCSILKVGSSWNATTEEPPKPLEENEKDLKIVSPIPKKTT